MLTVRRWRNTIPDGQRGIEGLLGVMGCADGAWAWLMLRQWYEASEDEPPILHCSLLALRRCALAEPSLPAQLS
jgi:hypothetical protein